MSVLDDYRRSTVGSHETNFFLEVPTDLKQPNTKAFHMAFLRNESQTTTTNTETETIADVTLKTQPTEVKTYAPSQEINGRFLKNDPVCRYLLDLYDRRAVGSEAYTNIIEVRNWDDKRAFKSLVTVAIESIVMDAGDTIGITGTIGYASDPVEGTAEVDGDTGIATFTAKGDEITEV